MKNFIAIFICLVFSADLAFASCIQFLPGTPAEAKVAALYDTYGLIFSGKVKKVWSNERFGNITTFEVIKCYKGQAEGEIEIYQDEDGYSTDSIHFEENVDYLVYADKWLRDYFSTNECTLTKRLKDAGEDIEAITKIQTIPNWKPEPYDEMLLLKKYEAEHEIKKEARPVLETPKEDVRSFEVPLAEIENISVNHKQGSLGFVLQGTDYFYYVEAPTEVEQIMAVSQVYNDILSAATVQITHVPYGLHRRVVNLLVFHGKREITDSLSLFNPENMGFDPTRNENQCPGRYKTKITKNKNKLTLEIDQLPGETLSRYKDVRPLTGGKRITVYFNVEPGRQGADYALYIYKDQWTLRKSKQLGCYDQEVRSGRVTLLEDNKISIVLNKRWLRGTLDRCWSPK